MSNKQNKHDYKKYEYEEEPKSEYEAVRSAFKKVKQFASPFNKIMIVLDSNHTHEHVLDELKLYADLVSPGCMLLVLDTVIDDLNVDPDRPWGPGASPKSAVIEYMKSRPGIFENFNALERRAVLSVAPNGYWIRSGKS